MLGNLSEHRRRDKLFIGTCRLLAYHSSCGCLNYCVVTDTVLYLLLRPPIKVLGYIFNKPIRSTTLLRIKCLHEKICNYFGIKVS